MAIDAGDLTHVIELQSAGSGKDSHGAATAAWATFDTVCGAIEAVNYRDALQTAAATSTLLSAVTIYYRSDLSVKHRLLVEGRQLSILSLQDPDGDRELLRLICAEVQGQA